MPLRLSCPHCSHRFALDEPLPLPGEQVRCVSCGRGMVVTYPDGVFDTLRARGKRFAEPTPPVQAPSARRRLTRRRPQAPGATDRSAPADAPADAPPADPAAPASAPPPSPEAPADPFDFGAPRPVRRTGPTPEATPADGDRPPVVPVPSMDPAPLPAPLTPPEAAPTEPTPAPDAFAPSDEPEAPTHFETATAPPEPDPAPAGTPERPPITVNTRRRREAARSGHGGGGSGGSGGGPPGGPSGGSGRSWRRRALRGLALLVVLGVLAVPAGYFGALWWYGEDLPSIETLRRYEPATVTTVHASDGTLLGEIYEERRYVLPIDAIPERVQQAFIAAEDANFRAHGGIDYMGIARAMVRNLRAGRISQGGSTITQQVAKNFLLSADRRLERKIKEAFLSWRIEDAYDKDHILYLYLNEIFLGSQAYGVEAAARTFFGKHVDELTLGETAILAGLPPRPSAWNPHRDIEASKRRQAYVLDQMVKKSFITPAEAEAARAEEITVIPRGNTFREQAPHFTEYARRYLVERYGEDRVLNEGLSVTTTCDLDLQRTAQEAVTSGVYEVDQRMGFRREAIQTLAPSAIDAHVAAYEASLREAWATSQDPAGRVEAPERSVLEAGAFYEGVITEVTETWARVSVGAHEGIIPIAWTRWAFVPNPERSWRYRKQDDFTRPVDVDGDGESSGGILRVGDVVEVRIEALSTRDEAVAEAFEDTPGEASAKVALRLWQDPEVESALLSVDLDTMAVRAMVGGSDFGKSQFNRAVQSYRQVGSTFKPIVYAAALQTKKLTTASLIPDAPLAFGNATTGEVWKPSNYGDDYLGNITLRKALALSRNTCTVRVLDIVDPGMSTGVVYDFARALGIGGPPTHLLPDDVVPTPDNDHLCPWVPETVEQRQCLDRYPPIPEDRTRAEHLEALENGAEHLCRECDLSMALGSASLTMEELVRAYSVFATGGRFRQPYYIEEVRDRTGTLLERHEPEPPTQVVDPAVASLAVWLMRNVVDGGTGYAAKRELGVPLAGKTGTTNDEKDAWFVGYTPDVITAVWVGYDQPRSLGVSSTGGRTALPIWIDYMREAIDGRSTEFPTWGDIDWALIDEETGQRVTGGGRSYPFLEGTVPEATGFAAGQASLEDLSTEL